MGQRLNSKIFVVKIFIIVFFLLLPDISAQANEITLWIMAGEYPGDESFSEHEIENFRERYPYASIDIGRDKKISEIVLLENEEILKQIDDFRGEFTGKENINPEDLTIKIKFIGWHMDPLGRIENDAIKEGVDAVQIGSTWTAYLANQNVLEIINDVVNPIEHEYVTTVLQSCRKAGGKDYYALPWSLDIRTWFYNRNLLDRSGIRAEDINNLKSFEESCRVFKDKFKGTDNWFLGMPTARSDYSTLHAAMSWIWGWGGSLVDHENRIRVLNNETLEGINHYAKLAVQGCMPIQHEENTGLRLVDIQEDFLSGKYGLILIGPWILDAISGLDHSEDFVNFGTIPGLDASSPNVFTGGSNLALIKSDRTAIEDKAAKELIVFLSRNTHHSLGLSATKARLNQLIDDPDLRPFAKTLLGHESRSYPSIPEWGQVEDIMVGHVANVFEKLSSEGEIKNLIELEFTDGRDKLEKVVKQKGDATRRYIVIVLVLLILVITIVLYILWKRKPTIGVLDAVRKFQHAKDILHRAKIFAGDIENNESLDKERANLAEKMKEVLQEFQVITKSGRRDRLSAFAKTRKSILTKYLSEISRNDLRPSEYEDNIIDFFERTVRPVINDMYDILNKHYLVNPESLRNILETLQRSYRGLIVHNIPNNTGTLIISAADLISCLENLLQNANRAITDVTKPIIELKVARCETSVCVAVHDNGSGIPHDKLDRLIKEEGAGQGVRDIRLIMQRWDGDINITSEGEQKGTTVTLNLRGF